LLERGDGHEAAAGAGRLVSANRHLDLRSREDLDRVAGAHLDDRLLPAGLRALEGAAALRLRLHLDDVDADDLDVAELLDRLAHLRLVRVRVEDRKSTRLNSSHVS